MQNLSLHLQATGNFGSAQAAVNSLTTSTNALGAAFTQAALASDKLDGSVNPAKYRAHANAVAYGGKIFRDAAASTGMFETSQIRAASQVEEFTKSIRNQKVNLGQFLKERNKMVKSAYHEQMRLRKAFVYNQGTDMYGNQNMQLAVPKNVPVSDLKNWNNQLAYTRALAKSISKEMVNVGKNTQWAGRQLTVGFTVPAMIAGAFTGMQAYGVDKELTRIAKVYDTVTTNAVSKEHELNQVRKDSIALAKEAASAYATSAEETLQLTAEFAATGLNGKELTETTNEALRIATLGEIEHQTALESTIALQSVFKMSNEELADSFNYMNAVENATSLQLADFAAAIPIAAAPVKAFGGDIQELGVLLTAMRENGIGAVQGANAIKASMQRLGRPSKQIRMEFQELTGTDIVKLVDESSSLIEIFQKINEVTTNLSGADQRKVYAGLFGSYQVSRMMAMTQGMGDLSKGIGQVSKAYELAGGSAADWQAAADSEMAKMQQSASFRIQATWKTLKVELAEIGEDFLEIGANILDVVNTILNAFNKLPEGVKSSVTSIIGLVALAGPIIMLGGLATNLAGQFIYGLQAIMGLVTGVKAMDLVTRKTVAADAQAKLITDTYEKQAEATRNLKNEVLGLAHAMETSMSAQHLHVSDTLENQIGMGAQNVFSAEMPQTQYDNYYQVKGGQWRQKGKVGASAAPPDVQAWKDHQKSFGKFKNEALGAAAAADELAEAAVESKTQIAVMGDGAQNTAARTGRLTKVLGGASMAMLLVGSSTGMLSSELMTLMGILTALQIAASAGLFTSLGKWVKSTKLGTVTGGLFTTIIGKAKIAGKAISSFIFGPWGVGIALAITGVTLLYKHLNKPLERQKAIAKSTDMWVDKLGVAESNVNKFATGMAKAKAEADETLEAIKAMGEELENTEAGKALIESLEDADYSERLLILQKEAIKLSGNTDASDEDIEMAMRALLDKAGVAGSQVEKSISEVRKTILQGNSKAISEVFDSLISDITDSNLSTAREKIPEVAGLFSTAFADADTAADARTYIGRLGLSLKEESARLEGLIAEGGSILTIEGYKDELEKIGMTEKEIVRTIAERNGVIDAGNTIQSLQSTIWFRSLDLSRKQKEEEFKKLVAQREAYRASGNHFNSLSGMTDAAIRQQLGLVDAVEKEERARIRVQNAMKAQYKARRELMGEFMKGGWADVEKTAMQNIMAMIADSMQEDFSSYSDAARDAMDAEAEAEDANFETRLDKSDRFYDRRVNQTKRAYDRQIRQIERILDKEDELEKRRQALHDAEMRRISRAQDARNTAIDLNVALASGQLDEAARILSNAQATEEEYALEDSERAAQERLEAREARLEARINRLERRRDSEVKGLEKAKKLKKEEIEAERDKAKEIQKINRDALDRRLTMEKKNLDEQIRLFQSWVPRNKAEVEKWMRQLEGKHTEFGKHLKSNSKNWSEMIGDKYTKEMQIAGNELKTKMDWAGLGRVGSNKMLRGMADSFGMNVKEFRKWLGLKEPTGKTKKDRNTVRSKDNPTPGLGKQIAHGGGPIGPGGKDDRTGFAGGISARESLVLAKNGEYMVNDRAVQHYGQDFMDSVNSMKFGTSNIRNESDSVGLSRTRKVAPTPKPRSPSGDGQGSVTGRPFASMAAMSNPMMAAGVAVAKSGLNVLSGLLQQKVGDKRGASGGAAGPGGAPWAGDTFAGGWKSYPGLGAVAPWVAEAARYIGSKYNIGTIHGFGYRGNSTSDHPKGLALDFMTWDKAKGTAIANEFIRNPKLDSTYVIWQQAINSRTSGNWTGWRGMGDRGDPTQNHYDHVHVSFTPNGVAGDINVPGLRKGAEHVRWNNTLANLHHGETVLTKDLSSKFKQGVDNFASGGGNEYNVHIHSLPANASAEDVANLVIKKIKRVEKNSGISRRIGD